MDKDKMTLRTFFVLAGAITATQVFAFTTFETKENVRDLVTSRLDRIEAKLDKLLEYK